MRIILVVVFYIAIYVARVADGGDTTGTMPENSMKRAFKQKSEITRDRIPEVPIYDEMTHKTNKPGGRSLLASGMDGSPRNRRILNSNLARVRRGLRKKKKRAMDSNGKIARRRNDFEDDNDTDEKDTLSDAMRGLPVWQIPEPTIPTTNFTTNPTIVQTEMINQTFKRPRSQLENLNAARFFNEAILPMTERYPNSRGLFDANDSDENSIFSEIPDPRPEIKFDVRSPAFGKPNGKILLSPYHRGTLTDVDSPDSSRLRGFQWQFSGHQDSASPRNIKEELSNNYPTGSNERFLLVPVSRDLYVLKNIRDSSRTGTEGIIVPERHKPSERNKDNVTSAILSFKAHMHHDVKDIGRAYLQAGLNDRRLSDHNANYLYSDDSRRLEETSPTADPMPLSYPNFLYPGVAHQTHAGVINTVPEISDEPITLRVPDYGNIPSSDINVGGEINSYDSLAFLSTSSSFDTNNYDVPSYLKENASDRRASVLSAIKFGEIDPFRSNSGNYEDSLEYNEFGVEMTTADFRSTSSTFDGSVLMPVTAGNAEMYLIDNSKETFDISQSVDDSSIGRDEGAKTDFADNISARYIATSDTFKDTTYPLVTNAEDILNNRDINKNNEEFRTAILNGYNNKNSIFKDFNYDDRFIDEVFNNYTTKDSFLNVEDYTTSASLVFNTDEWSLKKEQPEVDNSRTLLMAIKPLSSELQKLLNAVKLVNQSISNVQSRLRDKKNVKSARSKEGKVNNNMNHYDISTKNFDGRSSNKRPIKTEGGNIVDQTTNDVELKKKRKERFLLLNKLTIPLHKRGSSIGNSEIRNDRKNSFKKSKRKFPRSDNVERRKLSHSRFNRNLKSLTKNYEEREKPIRRFIESGLKKMTRATTPVVTLSRLIRSNVSRKNNFVNVAKRAQNFQGNDSKSISLSFNTPLAFFPTNGNNRTYLLSNNNSMQRNATRAMSSESNPDKEKRLPETDPQSYRQATAYLDILRLLDITEEPRTEYPTVTWTTPSESLLSPIPTTTELSVTTATVPPYFVEAPTTIVSTIAVEPPEVTESTSHATSTDYEYYKYGEDYDERNYTGIYGDYDYEDQGDLTSWYAEGTTTKEVSAESTLHEATGSFGITAKIDYEAEIETSTQALRYALITTTVVTTESLGTALPVTSSAFTVTTPTTLPLLLYTELSTVPIETATTEEPELTVSIPIEITEISVAIPTTEKFTTESVILLTPVLEGMTDITLKITIPAVTKASMTETPALIETVTAEEEIIESTLIGITQSFFTETSVSLFMFPTVPSYITTEIESTIRVTTPSAPLITAKKPRTTTPIEEITSVTERTITATTVSPIVTTIKSTTTSGESTTLQRAVTGKITYITGTETEMEGLIPFTTQTVTFTTRVPINITRIYGNTTLVAPEIKAAFTEGTTIKFTPEKLETTSAEVLTRVDTTTETTISITESFYTTFAEMLVEPNITSTEEASTYVTTVIAVSTRRVTESEIETSLMPTTISEITTIRHATTVTKPSTISGRTETALSTSTEFATTTVIPEEEESPVTQIEKTITAEEATTTETPITTEIPTPIKTQATSTTIETLTPPETTIIEALTPTSPMTSKIPTITETTTITEILTPTKIPPAKEATTITEISTPTEILVTTKITSIKETTVTETLTPTQTSTMETPTFTETPTTSKIPMTVKTRITKISIPTEILTTTKIPTTKEATVAETQTPTMETPTFTETPTTSKVPRTVEITITEISTPTEILATTKIPTTKKTTVTETLTPTETSAITETQTTSESLKTTKAPTIPTTYITFSTTESATPFEMTTLSKTKEYLPTSIPTVPITAFTTGTVESTPTSSITPVTTSAETVLTTLSTQKRPVATTSIRTTIPTTSLRLTTTTPLSPMTNTTLSETPCTTISTFPMGEIETSPIISVTTSTIEVFPTTPPTPLLTTTPFSGTSTAMYETLPTTLSTSTMATIETTTLSVNITSPEAFRTTACTTLTPSITYASTTPSEITASTFSVEMTESTISIPVSATISSTETVSTMLVTFSIETFENATSVMPIITVPPIRELITSSTLPIATTLLIDTSGMLTATVPTITLTISAETIPATVFTTEKFPTTYSTATVFSTTVSTIATEILESTMSPVMHLTLTSPSITEPPITPTMADTGTIFHETTSVATTFLTEITEGTIAGTSTEEYEKYYPEISTEKEIATSTAGFTTEERTVTWITTEKTTIAEVTIPMTYPPSFTTPFFIETTTEVISLVTETATLSKIAEETLLTEKITIISTTITEEISTLIFTERSTAAETSIASTSLTPTVSILEAAKTTAMLPTTERPEHLTILEATVAVTLAPFSESILSVVITSETPFTTPEVISVLPKAISEAEEFAMSTTESLLMITESPAILFVETTVQPVGSTSAATIEETPEVETEYYVAKEPLYEEEYEEYDTEIPTDEWYYYEETTAKKRTTATSSTMKYTKVPKKKATTPPFGKGTTTSSYEAKISEFSTYSTFPETASTYTDMISTAITSRTPYIRAEEGSTSTSALKTSESTTVANLTTIEAKTVSTTSTMREESTTMGPTFGSTEEYTLPTSTLFEIMTEPLEYLTIPPKYKERGFLTQIWRDITSPKFITRPEESPETEIAIGKLTSIFVSSVLTTLSEKEAIEIYVTTSTAFSEVETTTEIAYKVTTLETTTTMLITEEKISPRVTPFIAPEIEAEFTTTSKTVGLEEEKKELLQRLYRLKQYEREVAEREERLKEKEKQWEREKEKCMKMMRYEKEKATNITIVTGTTAGYVTTTIANLSTTLVETVGTTSLTASTITEIEVTSPISEIPIALTEVITVSTETTPFYATEESTSVKYTVEETTAEETTSATYSVEETEGATPFYTTEESTSVKYTVEETTAEESTSATYAVKETEEATPFYTTEESTSVKYTVEETIAEESTSATYAVEETEEATPFYTTEESTSATYAVEETEEATPFYTTEESTSVKYTVEETIAEESTSATYAVEETEEATPFYTTEESTSATYAVEETEEATPFYTTEESTSVKYTLEETIAEESTSATYIAEETERTYYTTTTPYIATFIVDLYNVSLTPVEAAVSYIAREMYTTSYMTLYSETSPIMEITSPITLTISEFATLSTATFGEIGVTSVTTERIYAETYTDVYSESSFVPSTFSSTIVPATGTTLAIGRITESVEEIESLREKLRKRERELEEREKTLLEREQRLEKEIAGFEKYIAEFEERKTDTPIASSEESTVSTSLSTPVPPTEKTTTKAQVTTQIKRVTEKKEAQTTTRMMTLQYETTEIRDVEKKERTKHVPEEKEGEEEEIVTKRICLNVLENTTIPLDKRRRDIVIKKVCLPYFPEKSEKKRSVGRLSRKLFALQNTRKIREAKLNPPSDFRYRRRRRVTETTRKINNLQLSYHEWLTNETTEPLRRFKGFTRIYEKTRKPSLRDVATVIDTQGVLVGSFFQPTTMQMLGDKRHRKRNILSGHDSISIRKNSFSNNAKVIVGKRDVQSTEKNIKSTRNKSVSNQGAATAIAEEEESDEDENGSYTVNVLRLGYNKDEETHEIISARPDEGELTAIESNDDNYINEFEEDAKITTPRYELEENNLKEEDDEPSDKIEEIKEEDDYLEDMIDNYMNYEEHETPTPTHDKKFLDDQDEYEKITESGTELWPTEKSTIYHLGGTRFWELDFEVTEPPAVLSTTTKKSKTVDVSVTKTTCFDVVLKNERNIDTEINNVHRPKRSIYNNEMRKHNISMKKRDTSFKNVTRKNMLYNELRTKRSSVMAKDLRNSSRKLCGSNHYKQSFEGRKTVKFDEFTRISNDDSVIAKNRKLCGVDRKKSKRHIIKHKDTINIKNKNKKKQPAKSQKPRNINSLKGDTNNATNKKNPAKYHKTTRHFSQIKNNNKNDEKIARSNIIADRKDKSVSVSHERKIRDCSNCICDIANVISNIKSILDKRSFPLDEIKALNCSGYKETQDEIIISMDFDIEEAKAFPQPHYNTESLKGQKYIKLEELEDDSKSDLELDDDHDIVSLPGLNLNLPCNQDSDGITWLSSISRPSYTWKRTDGIAPFGFVAENGDLELRNVNAKDTGNYTCVMTYMGPDNEEPVETTYEIHLQVVTLPRYIIHGESHYHTRSCDDRDLDVLTTYLPPKLNSIICEADICNAYVLMPSCSRSQITINVLLVPSHIVKLMTVDPKHCNVFCLKAIQDKLSLILSKNLQVFLGKTIIFRLSHYEQRLVPIAGKPSFTRWKRGRTGGNAFGGGSSNAGLFSSCPAGYGLRGTHCVPCNMGTYSEDGISHCKKCPPGTHQPNHGARVCRTCTNPLTKGCSNMLWNSFSAVMVTLASLGAMLSIFLLMVWIICCAKKKFCIKQIASMIPKEDAFKQEEHAEEQPLIKDISENEDQQWDSEYRVKKKKGKFYVNKKHRKQNEKRKCEKIHAHEDEWGSHRIKNAPIICPNSYRSHEDYNNYYPKRSCRKGPRLPEYDFDI